MKMLKKFIDLLSFDERKHTAFLVVIILIMALLDMIGVASILPFIAVLSNPDFIETNFILNSMFRTSNIFGVTNHTEFMFALGVLVFVLLVVSLSFKALTTYVQARFVYMCEHSISRRLIEGYLNQPYSWFLNRNSAELGKTILSEMSQVVGGGIKPLIEILAKGMVATALIILLMITDFKLALIVGISISASYGIIFYLIRSFLSRIGKKRFKSNEFRYNIINEVFGGIKEVKIGGLEKTYVKRFSDPSIDYARTQAYASALQQLPRFALEVIAFGGILLVILSYIGQNNSFNTALPIITLYAFAGYRLMPAVQQIYSSFTQLNFVGPALNKLHDDIKNLDPYNYNQNQSVLPFKDKITLKNIHYFYPNASRTTLKDISINIPVQTTVGLIGATGCGKTTAVDIILGLLQAQKGTLEVDGQIITKHNTRAWQRSIGYVPQNIYLADDTVASNIAFGEDPEYIDQKAVEKSSKIANLHDFVMDELPHKYQTTIGERGIRLSGGQRQRIGIARALYNNPKVLILDEATNALDSQTEQAVMDAVNKLSKDITIILIAHRLNTLKKCDIIFKLEKGKLVDQGTFDELIERQ
tara:strand:+ start:4226 stop:5989 length:1764 start_codon:yes stop_codon:yes gene_type:complete